MQFAHTTFRQIIYTCSEFSSEMEEANAFGAGAGIFPCSQILYFRPIQSLLT